MTTPEATPERFAKIRAIYLAAARLAASERAEFIATECANDTALAEEVHALLALGDADEADVNAAIADVATRLRNTMDNDVLPDGVGPYRVLDTLGHGGMGRVYLAERADGHFDQKVAIKLVDRNRLSTELVARFRSERQILASLDHANIARLTDGGETDDGIPYLVMEYVDGTPVDQYCDAATLTISERLELFIRICEAVEYAHRNLVVHRDLKPSNILVTESGVPKLLDFGIAKLLSRDSIDYTMAVTVGDARLMTPRNASPEQVRGDAITTATDIYALGLLLYELLTGRFPYDSDGQAGYTLEKQICESEPARPSARVTQLDDTADSIQTARRVPTAEQLRRQLAGDLDNIVLVAMRKEPERRYATVRELADDVRAYLDHRPIRARGDSLHYRTGKFLRRNPGGVALATGSLVIVAALIASYTYRLGLERDRAELEAAKAVEVAGFMTSLFKEADPRLRGSEPMSITDMLNRGADRARLDLVGQPELQASLMATIGESFHNLWELERARDYLQAALPGFETTLGANHPDVLRIRYTLGMSTSFLGDYEAGMALHRQNYEQLVEQHGRNSAEAATELHQIAFTQSVLGQHEEAERNFLELIAIFRSLGDEGRLGLSTGLYEYATLLNKLDRGEEDLALTKEALAIREALYGNKHPHYAAVLNNLANSYWSLQRFDEAGELMRENMAIQRELYGDTSIPYGVSLMNYSSYLSQTKRFEEASEYLANALPIYRDGYGEDHPRYAYLHENLGGNFQDRGDFDTAEQYFNIAIDILAARFGENHLEVAITRSRYGNMLVELERYEDARVQLEPTVTTMREAFGEAHSRTTTARQRLANAYVGLGRTDDALDCLQISIDALTPPANSLRDNLLSLLDDKASMLAQTGDTDTALSSIETALSLWQSMGVIENSRFAFLDATYAEVLAASGERDAAIAFVLERERFYTDEFGAEFEHISTLRGVLTELGVSREPTER
ncbi:MAG: serine/threonine-protein kinase [Pseudomonadota bacterium]